MLGGPERLQRATLIRPCVITRKADTFGRLRRRRGRRLAVDRTVLGGQGTRAELIRTPPRPSSLNRAMRIKTAEDTFDLDLLLIAAHVRHVSLLRLATAPKRRCRCRGPPGTSVPHDAACASSCRNGAAHRLRSLFRPHGDCTSPSSLPGSCP